MCLEIDSGGDNDREIKSLRQTASFMFHLRLIPKEGRGSKEWLPPRLLLLKNLCPPLKRQSPETPPVRYTWTDHFSFDTYWLEAMFIWVSATK